MLLASVALLAVVMIPAAFAWLSWYKSARLDLPLWRNIGGAISLMFTTAAPWLLIIDARENSQSGFATGRVLSFIAIPFAFFLTGRARSLAIAAAVLAHVLFFRLRGYA